MTQSFVADLSASKPRERELYTIPISSSWFRWEEIHETERRSLPEFFDGGSYSRSPRVYKEYRDFIINKYREDPSRRLTFTDVRKSLVGDVGTLRKVFLFLEKWGLVNFGADNCKRRRQLEVGCGLQVLVEDGPPAGVRVVPMPSGSSSTTSRAQTGGDCGFKLPALTSYRDAFGEWIHRGGLVCAACGGQSGSVFNGLAKDGVTICSNCLSKQNAENGKSEDLKPVDLVNGKSQSAAVWTDAETLLLLEAVLKHGDDWDLVAQHVRTKNKLDCISRLIFLPFGEHMLETVCRKLNNTNTMLATSEYSSSLDALDDNVRVPTKADEVQNDTNKAENGDSASLERPLKQRCLSSFTDPTDSLMKQVASLSALSTLNVNAAALDAAIEALCHENPCARMAFETDGEEIVKPSSSTFKNKSKSDNNVEDRDAGRGGDTKGGEQPDYVHTIFRIRAAIATALASAAARAKFVAHQEEKEMELLMASIIQAQLKKLQYKMKHLIDMGLIMEKEYSLLQQLKDSTMEEWIATLRKLFCAGILRWLDQGFPKNLLHTNC
ncbi:SWI/SNF complex subunit SWI3A [Apostasia shenzhenica]|uniref:SWI/SNF complex subunit SWI3A n=1 Tax=Apostasia shenzhenica TaxID=1088818 RepID=A0A2H9ZW45_9ASPA|nr:SWI/SNF complex subunit SWI3A [Apostasia shenzhenica]